MFSIALRGEKRSVKGGLKLFSKKIYPFGNFAKELFSPLKAGEKKSGNSKL